MSLMEKMAQAVHENFRKGTDIEPWEELEEHHRFNARQIARDMFNALSDAGYAVVPKEATDAEWDAAWETLQSNNWLTLRQHISVHHARTFFQAVRRAMLKSAPEVT